MDENLPLFEMNAGELASECSAGRISVEVVARAHLTRIRDRDTEVRAWVHLDEQKILNAAQQLDARRASGQPTGPLFGVPVGLKDTIDTIDFPTENGTPIDAGRQPQADADIVVRLKHADALIMGKTASTELATMHPANTRNPRNTDHTPGGSSSGSAAAVADYMVPLAVGTQTGGSVIRPASYCGIVGFKPSRDKISNGGILRQSPSLDQVGVFGRSVSETGLIASIIADDLQPVAGNFPFAADGASIHVDGGRPIFAFVPTRAWENAEPETRTAFSDLLNRTDIRVEEVKFDAIRSVPDFHRIVVLREMAASLDTYYQRGKAQLSRSTIAMIEEGQFFSEKEYQAALKGLSRVEANLGDFFSRYDAILTPAAPGIAPGDLTSTGSPEFCVIWTALGMPAVSLPFFTGPNGMPHGLQVVGPPSGDTQLLAIASWLERKQQPGR